MIGTYISSKFKDEVKIIEKLNLWDLGLKEFSKEYMQDFYNPNKFRTNEDIKQELIRKEILNNFIESNIVVINIPMYNFSYPTMQNYLSILYIN